MSDIFGYPQSGGGSGSGEAPTVEVLYRLPTPLIMTGPIPSSDWFSVRLPVGKFYGKWCEMDVFGRPTNNNSGTALIDLRVAFGGVAFVYASIPKASNSYAGRARFRIDDTFQNAPSSSANMTITPFASNANSFPRYNYILVESNTKLEIKVYGTVPENASMEIYDILLKGYRFPNGG